jgi:hypothetical protein
MTITPDQTRSLLAFARAVLEGWPEGAPDACELQDIAVSAGLLVERTVTEPCGESCACAEYYDQADWEEGQTCYRRAPWLLEEAGDG